MTSTKNDAQEDQELAQAAPAARAWLLRRITLLWVPLRRIALWRRIVGHGSPLVCWNIALYCAELFPFNWRRHLSALFRSADHARMYQVSYMLHLRPRPIRTPTCTMFMYPRHPGCSSYDQRPYRAAQIRKWVFEKRAGSWEQMTDLPRGLREQLASEFDIWSAEIAVHRKDDDGTEKLLLTLADGRQRSRHTACAVRPEHEASETDMAASQADGTRRVPATQRSFANRMRALARRQGPLQHVHQHAGRLCDEVRLSAPRVWAA